MMRIEQYFPKLYLSDLDDLDMTCGDYVNDLKMLICSENTLFLELTMAIPKRW